jgi:hypothetical protein
MMRRQQASDYRIALSEQKKGELKELYLRKRKFVFLSSLVPPPTLK